MDHVIPSMMVCKCLGHYLLDNSMFNDESCRPFQQDQPLFQQKSISSSLHIIEQFKDSTIAFASSPTTPKSTRFAMFFVCGVDMIPLSLVLVLIGRIIMLVFVVSILLVLGLQMKTKTAASRSRLSSSPYNTSTVITSPTPSQPDTFRYRHLKTDSYCLCYLRHFGYVLKHSGYVLDTVTTSWVIVTLIALSNPNLKNSGSCNLHVPMNIGLELIQSSLGALIHFSFFSIISLALYVWSSLL